MRVEIKRYLALGITLTCVMLIGIILFFSIGKFDVLQSNIKWLIGIISPFIYGSMVAYILSPLCNFLERKLYSRLSIYMSSAKRAKKLSEKIAIVLAYIFLCLFIYIFLKIVMPQVLESLKSIITIVPEWINKLYDSYEKLAKTNPELGEYLNDYAVKLYDRANTFLEKGVFDNAKLILSEFSLRVVYFSNGILNLVVAVIVSIYVLNSRKTFKAQFKKLIYALFKKDIADAIISELRFADVSFGGFIIGKIIDSFIIGIIASVCLYLLRMPYAILLAIIIGFTNVIPFFGPIIGAVPGVILILFIDPLKALYFVIFVFILQQFDGNILGPKILGDKVGIPSFWVLFSIIVFGSLWGVFGMIVGVPLFAVIIDIVTKFVNRMLKKRGLSCDTNDYYSKEEFAIKNNKKTIAGDNKQ